MRPDVRLAALACSGLVMIGLAPLLPDQPDVPPHRAPSASRFVVILRTSDIDKGGTDADIDFGLTWSTPEGEKRGQFLVLPDGPGNNHEKGHVDAHLFKLDTPVPLDNVWGAQIVNEMGGDKPGWHVHSIAVMALDANDEVWLLADAPVNRWLERSSPAMCSFAAPVLAHPKPLGARSAVRGLSSLAFAQDLPDKQREDVQRAIAERSFDTPARKQTASSEPD
jgi:hypothetical protein